MYQLSINTNIILFISDSFVFICDFHREQSWTRWVTKLDNGVSSVQSEVLSMLRRCAHANTVYKFHDAVIKLQDSPVWEYNTKLNNWFSQTWLPEKKVCTMNFVLTMFKN